ncbi:putative membrane protein [Brevibacillus laterosporus GI-9]|nr:putative membrane protein [Brevibacillus laterosporus GI-9]
MNASLSFATKNRYKRAVDYIAITVCTCATLLHLLLCFYH